MFYFLSSCAEVHAMRIELCVMEDHFLLPQSHLSSLQRLPATGSSWVPAGFLQVPPNSATLCPLLGFWSFRLSCGIEQLVVHRGGQLEHVRHFCKALPNSSASLALSLALAPWVRVLNRVFALKRLSYALLSVKPTLTPFIPCLLFFYRSKKSGEQLKSYKKGRSISEL